MFTLFLNTEYNMLIIVVSMKDIRSVVKDSKMGQFGFSVGAIM
jgi:hypothetical protein